MAEEKNPKPENSTEKKPPAKKEKPPKLEDKPFGEFIEQHYLPALKEALVAEGLEDITVSLSKQKVSLAGMSSDSEWAQVQGDWFGGQRHFRVYFPDEDIKGQLAFACFERSNVPSTIEPFLIDERKIDLKLLVFYVVQRLNGQKWLTWN